MKKVISTFVATGISVLGIFVMAMSCISYANANIVESTFNMCRVPLLAEKEEVSEEEDTEQVYIPDEETEVAEDTPIEYVIVEEPVESAEPVVSVPNTEATDEIEETPIPTESKEPETEEIEEIIISDTYESASEISNEPVVSQNVTINYVSGQLPLGNYGMGAYVGRLTIPSVGVDVAVYHSNSQSAVDAVDSAGAYYGYESQPDYANYAFVIADHNYQGFNTIKNCVIGTEAYITTANGTYSYVCDRIILNGHNEGHGILDENYNLVYNQESGGMWLQTCNDTWTNDTLVHFYHK